MATIKAAKRAGRLRPISSKFTLGLLEILVLGFDYLFDTPFVPAALEVRGEPGFEYLFRLIIIDKPSGQRKHICIVVLAGQTGYIRAPRDCGAHPVHLVCGDRHAGAGTTNQQALVSLSIRNRTPDL